MDLHFECTRCGRCCHDLKLPLSLSEARAWLDDGHSVEVMCEAAPWFDGGAGHPWHAGYRVDRSFLARSGTLPVRVAVTLAAAFAGACPNLTAELQCGIYARRPLVCRIYPAEIRPGLTLNVQDKACPPPAWEAAHPIFVRRGQVVDASLQALIQRSRDDGVRDVAGKEQLCASLGLDCAALADEGWVIHRPDRDVLRDALRESVVAPAPAAPRQWRLLSNRQATLDDVGRRGACGVWVDPRAAGAPDYLGLYATAA